MSRPKHDCFQHLGQNHLDILLVVCFGSFSCQKDGNETEEATQICSLKKTNIVSNPGLKY